MIADEMQMYETRPRRVTAIEVTEENAEALATMVGGEVIWGNDPRFTNKRMYPIVAWDTSVLDEQGSFAHRGSYIVDERWRYVMVYSAAFHNYYTLKEIS